MNLKVENSQEELELSGNFRPILSPYRRRVQVQPRYGGDGGQRIGDRKTNSRNVSINFNITSESGSNADENYYNQLQQIVGIFREDLEPFYLVDTQNSRRMQVELESLNDRPAADGTLYRVGENNMELICLDGYWEDENSTTIDSGTAGLGNGDSLVVNNDADVDSYPVITIRTFSDNSEFSLTNQETGSLFRISTAAFVAGTEIIVSAVDGTVYLSDGVSQVEISSSLSDGSGMIKLIPGNNTLVYESIFSDAEVIVEYRKRYVF